jgi:flagellar biogenesis protein FliO
MIEGGAWIAMIFVLPFVLGAVFPARRLRVALVGFAVAVAQWSRYWFGDTDGYSRGEIVAFGGLYLSVALLLYLACAWTGRRLRSRIRRAAPGENT